MYLPRKHTNEQKLNKIVFSLKALSGEKGITENIEEFSAKRLAEVLLCVFVKLHESRLSGT